MEGKVCKSCDVFLPFESFMKSKMVSDGYENKCKPCRKEERKKSFICTYCGNEYKAVREGKYCGNVCSGLARRKGPEEFAREFANTHEGYTLMSEYKTNRDKVTVRHDNCGRVFEATPNNLRDKGSRCPSCFGNEKKDTEDFKREVFELVGTEYEVLSDYENSHKKIEMKHIDCSHIYQVTPDKFLGGRRCPNCKVSKGEDAIRKYLLLAGYTFAREVKFEGCKYKRELPFDFAVYKNNKVLALIEFDGEQHFKTKEFFGGSQGHTLTKLRDKIKDEFCSQNNIPLIRIPYYELENVPSILECKLGDLNRKIC